MKTSILIAAVLTLSSASFAQQVRSKNHVEASATVEAGQPGASAASNVNASSATTASGNTVGAAKSSAGKRRAELNKEAAREKANAKEHSRETAHETDELTREKAHSEAGIHEHSSVKNEDGNNKTSADASLNSQYNGSVVAGNRRAKRVHARGRHDVQAQAEASEKASAEVKDEVKGDLDKGAKVSKHEIKKVHQAKGHAKEGSVTVVNAHTGVQQGVKARPMPVSMHSRVNSAAGIKIK